VLVGWVFWWLGKKSWKVQKKYGQGLVGGGKPLFTDAVAPAGRFGEAERSGRAVRLVLWLVTGLGGAFSVRKALQGSLV
jgi:hypothetical protein